MFKLKDPFSGLSHLIGAVLSVIALVVLIAKAARYVKQCQAPSTIFFIRCLALFYVTAHTLPFDAAPSAISPRCCGKLQQLPKRSSQDCSLQKTAAIVI